MLWACLYQPTLQSPPEFFYSSLTGDEISEDKSEEEEKKEESEEKVDDERHIDVVGDSADAGAGVSVGDPSGDDADGPSGCSGNDLIVRTETL